MLDDAKEGWLGLGATAAHAAPEHLQQVRQPGHDLAALRHSRKVRSGCQRPQLLCAVMHAMLDTPLAEAHTAHSQLSCHSWVS